jgi:hypothetical protein
MFTVTTSPPASQPNSSWSITLPSRIFLSLGSYWRADTLGRGYGSFPQRDDLVRCELDAEGRGPVLHRRGHGPTSCDQQFGPSGISIAGNGHVTIVACLFDSMLTGESSKEVANSMKHASADRAEIGWLMVRQQDGVAADGAR